MNGTLPLFQELEVPRSPESAREQAPAARAATPPDAPKSPQAVDADRHLRAAWRLSRAMSRLPDGSPEQTRAGLAICRHLQALLSDAR